MFSAELITITIPDEVDDGLCARGKRTAQNDRREQYTQQLHRE